MSITDVILSPRFYISSIFYRYKELIKTPGSHLDSHQTSSINQSQFKGYKIVISNLEFSVTNEDINVNIKYYLRFC